MKFKLVEQINKLSLPATILIASIVLGGCYYFSQTNKQNSIERQQRLEIETKKQEESSVRIGKIFCVDEATDAAKEQYKSTCTYECIEGYYYITNYDNYYKTCLQRKGIE